MKSPWIFVPLWTFVLLCPSLPALALSGNVEQATVTSMHRVACQPVQTLISTGQHGEAANAPREDCVEYELRTATVSYIVRPRSPVLLLLGSNVSLRVVKDKLMLRTAETPREIHCAVVAMSLLEGEERPQRRAPACLNSLGEEIPCLEEHGQDSQAGRADTGR